MWDRIKRTDKPVVLYGTGNAAERILNELDVRGIRASGIFASDGFVRDRYFRGFKVLSYAEAKETFGDMLVLLAFGSHLPSVTAQIEKIASEQELLVDLFHIVDGQSVFPDDPAQFVILLAVSIDFGQQFFIVQVVLVFFNQAAVHIGTLERVAHFQQEDDG